jgi:predicted transcriptional regulator
MAEGKRDEVALSAIAERCAALLTASGFPRMPARVLMALTVSDEPGLTAVDLAERLGASAAAISGAVRYLQTVVMVRRVAQQGSRRDLYELPHDAWFTASLHQNPLYESAAALAEEGMAATGGPGDPAYERLAEMADFMRFVKRRLPELLVEWRASRA